MITRVPRVAACELDMFNLSNLRSLLLQVLSLPSLHTAVLFTPEGQLVSYAADPHKSKDHVRVVVGLSTEIWQETKEQGIGMVDSEVGVFLEVKSTKNRLIMWSEAWPSSRLSYPAKAE